MTPHSHPASHSGFVAALPRDAAQVQSSPDAGAILWLERANAAYTAALAAFRRNPSHRNRVRRDDACAERVAAYNAVARMVDL